MNALIFAGAVVVLALAAALYVRQTRLARRLTEREHQASELRAAYEAEKRVADTLKDAFALKPLPVMRTVQFSATYTPAAEEAKVGGDWYDVIDVDSRRVLFVVGDVAGHGLEAAVAMVRARQELMAAAVPGIDPAAVLVRANAELLRQRARMVTALCGLADAAEYRFEYAAAGHPPPVLAEPGRPPRLLECGGMPLGLLPNVSYASHSVQTVPGAMLVLYTDGALEHSHDVIEGERILLDAVAVAYAQRAPDPAAAIRDTVFAGRPTGDDVAILTISFAPATATRTVFGAAAGRSGDDPGARRTMAP